MPTRPRITAKELWDLGEGDVWRELVNGEVMEMPPVGGVHGEVTLRSPHRAGEGARGADILMEGEEL